MESKSRLRAVLMTSLAAVVLSGLIAGSWALRERWRVEKEDRQTASLRARLEQGGGDAEEHHRMGVHLVWQEGNAEGLAHLELAAERTPENLVFGNDVRLGCLRSKQYDRSIRFFERLVERNPALPEARLNLALAYVDKMPDHMMGIVGQGKLSKQSIGELNRILERSPAPPAAADANAIKADANAIENEQTHWAALYALGLNHLYWPKALRHAAAAEEALRRCIEFQKTMKGAEHAYFALPYVALGDALVKEGRHAEARGVWKEAQSIFPDEGRLKERLALDDDGRLTEYVDGVRGLGVVVDTDLSILWGRRP